MSNIYLNLDVSKVDKTKLFKGKTGTWLNVLLVATPNSRFRHDYMALQSITKEEREAGMRGAKLGNGVILYSKDGSPPNDEPLDEAGDFLRS
jgi:hypothetical protein